MLWSKLIVFAVFSLVLAHQVSSDQDFSGCKSDFTRVGDKCLLIVQNITNWYESDRYCRSLGAGLLSLENPVQLLQVEEFLSEIPYYYRCWTSGNKLGSNGKTFYWQSTGKEATYIPRAPGSVQYAGDCLNLYSLNSNRFMGELRCDYKDSIFSVCEHEPQQSVNTPTTTERICLKPESFETAQVVVN